MDDIKKNVWIARDPENNLRLFFEEPILVTKHKEEWTGEIDTNNPYGIPYKVYKATGDKYQILEEQFSHKPGIIVNDKYFKEFVRELDVTDNPIKIS